MESVSNKPLNRECVVTYISQSSPATGHRPTRGRRPSHRSCRPTPADCRPPTRADCPRARPTGGGASSDCHRRRSRSCGHCSRATRPSSSPPPANSSTGPISWAPSDPGSRFATAPAACRLRSADVANSRCWCRGRASCIPSGDWSREGQTPTRPHPCRFSPTSVRPDDEEEKRKSLRNSS